MKSALSLVTGISTIRLKILTIISRVLLGFICVRTDSGFHFNLPWRACLFSDDVWTGEASESYSDWAEQGETHRATAISCPDASQSPGSSVNSNPTSTATKSIPKAG